MNVYDFTVKGTDDKEVDLGDFKGKVLLIVNTASKCGFTPQYKELEELYQKYGQRGFTVLAFPCNQFLQQEPGDNTEIQAFCQLNYGVTFPVFEKIDVNGEKAHELFKYLTDQMPGLFGKSIKWNFTKFLVDAQGRVRHRYAPITAPNKITPNIEKLLNEASGTQC